ncbi:hypothetical protein ILYODFUR_038872, partial [Ilyodon furcidens]
QDSVSHKRFSPVQQEAKSGGFIAHTRKYLISAKRQRLCSAYQSNACESLNERGNVDGRTNWFQTRTATSQKEGLANCTEPSK